MSSVLQAEHRWEPNSFGRVLYDTKLFKKPTRRSKAYGKLPEGTIVTFIGERQGEFLLIEISLKRGKRVAGWIEDRDLEPVEDEVPDDIVGKKSVRKKKRTTIPEDESLLLGREPQFFYGAQLGLNYGFILPDGDPNTYSGIGFIAGGHLGFFAHKTVPIRLEVNYLQQKGSAGESEAGVANSNVDLDFGFLEFAVIPSIIMNDFELSLGLSYALGVSMGDIPTSINPVDLQSASDVSSLWGQASVGYRFTMTQHTSVLVRAKYAIAFTSYPFVFNYFGLMAEFQLRG